MNIALTFSLLMMFCPVYHCIGLEPVVSPENSTELDPLLLPDGPRSDHRKKAEKIPKWVQNITTQLERMTVLAQLQDPTSPQAIDQHKGKAKKVLGSDQDANRLAELIKQAEIYCEKRQKKEMAEPQRQIVQQALHKIGLVKIQLEEFNRQKKDPLCAQSFANLPVQTLNSAAQEPEDEDALPIRIHSMPFLPDPRLPFLARSLQSPPSAQSPLSQDPRSPRSALSPASPQDGPGV